MRHLLLGRIKILKTKSHLPNMVANILAQMTGDEPPKIKERYGDTCNHGVFQPFLLQSSSSATLKHHASIRIELDFDPAISGMIRPHETEHLLSIADGYQRSRNDIDCIIALVVPQNPLDPYQRFLQEQISSISFARYKAKWFIEARGGGNGKPKDCFVD